MSCGAESTYFLRCNMKRNIIVCVGLALCLVVTFIGIQQVEAKQPAKKQHIPSITLLIKQNPTTQHNYFNPANFCIRGMKAYITIKNTTSQVQHFEVSSSGSARIFLLSPGQSTTSLQTASDQTGGGEFEIDIELNPNSFYFPEDEAVIVARGKIASCI